MVGLLLIVFLVLPIAELAVLAQVAGAIGLAETILVLIAVSVTGAWLVKREGVGVLRRVQQQIDRGIVPGPELVDGFLILLAGALLLTPGFLTDCLGLLLLAPPTRAAFRTVLTRRFRRRVGVYDVREVRGNWPE
jgi:UPF0716 protein FxsA